MQNELLKRLLTHISSVSLFFLIIITYILNGNSSWLDDYLPINGKPLALFLLVGLIAVFEFSVKGQRVTDKKVDGVKDDVFSLKSQLEIDALKNSVNRLYDRFMISGDDFVTNEYTIKELYELVDTRARLKVNSHTQGRLGYLVSKIKRDVIK